jgi:hypothetical protein
MNAAIPHLSRDGWMKDPSTMVNKLFEYFIVSEYSQSNTFRGEVASLKYILEQNITGDEIKSAISKALIIMYGRYFSDVLVNADITDDSTNILLLTISVDVTSNGKRYALDKNLELNNGTLANMNELIADLYSY